MSGITHKKVVAGAQNPAFEVSKDEWNDGHDYSGLDAATLEGSNKATVQDHIPKAHTLASHSTKAHSELSDAPADAHHPSGNIRDSVLGLKTGIKAGTNITIEDDSGYAKISASGGGGGGGTPYQSFLDGDDTEIPTGNWVLGELEFELTEAKTIMLISGFIILGGETGLYYREIMFECRNLSAGVHLAEIRTNFNPTINNCAVYLYLDDEYIDACSFSTTDNQLIRSAYKISVLTV